MKERPILFSAPMVRAILDGRKTQTRRPVKRQPAVIADAISPLGLAGDRLWVRESWRYHDWTGDGLPLVQYAADDARRLCERIPAEWEDRVEGEWATLSDPANYAIDSAARDRRWRPSIHMPRWASRLALDVTAVRVGRLQSITEADAIAEGARRFDDLPAGRFATDARWSMDLPLSTDQCLGTARHAFGNLWDRVYTAMPWASNPWVWVIEFKRATEGATAP